MPIQDLILIDILPDDSNTLIIYKEVFLDQLVSLIDEAVERTDDYQKRICEELGIVTQT